VTCLVGKNESGKTALLKALTKLNAVDAGEGSFSPLDYPRRRWIPGAEIPNDPPALWTKWDLSPEDVAALEAKLAPGAIKSREVIATKSYDNVLRLDVTVDEAPIMRHLLSEANLTDPDWAALGEPPHSVSALAGTLQAMPDPGKQLGELQARLAFQYPAGAMAAAHDAVAELLPKIAYFDEYYTLPGQVALEDFAARKAQGRIDRGDRVFQALLELAGTTAEEIKDLDRFEDLNAALRAVSNSISRQIFQYWTQNRYLDAILRLDAARPGDPPPFNGGTIFRTRIDNTRHKSDTSFDERSRGFVWFFSFLVWFSQLKKRLGSRLVVLLDEPGLTLHARAQADLLRYVNEQLRPDHQVVYTTHSPFMIDPGDLLAARTVEDVEDAHGQVLGTKVGDRALSRDSDTISPLQRALDSQLAQTLFVGRNTLLVEGPADLVYLKWFSSRLGGTGARDQLDYRWSVCQVGGVDRVAGFASLFRGNQLNIVALMDCSSGHKQQLESAERALAPGHMLRADSFAGQADADFEDILGREFYVALVNAAYQLPNVHKLPDIRPLDAPTRVLHEVDAHFRALPPTTPAFDHTTAAKWLFDHPTEGGALPGFAGAISRVKLVIRAINSLIE
jgi:predicted ATPase